MLSMAVSASAQVSAPVASTQLPTGGKVMSGTTSIQSVGNVLNINQSSQRSAINWNTFNVGSGAKVNFIQPSASSVTLNRVLDTNGSQILGSISANGQVFISNPNGVLFGPNSQVNVGGLIATTQDISVDDFMAGKSTFEGTGAAGAVVNQGTLEAALGGYIALLAPSVRNEGVVLAREGTVAFAAGDKTVVQFNGPQLVTVMVDRPVLDALVENKQMVRADGGLVIFSARSANAVLSSVIRNTGTVQAQTIENKNGRILLIGDMQNGSIKVDGKLDASAPMQGDGGFIETSAAQVKIADSAVVTTLAKNGKTGTWLVDPHDYTVAASGGDQTGTQLSASLGTTNVTLQSASGSQTGSGNININDGVSWSANTNLTLTATNNVNVNANLSATGVTAGIAINPNTVSQSEAASGSGVFNIGSGASISLPNVLSSSTNALVISGTPYTVINSLGAQGSITGTDLQGMNGNLTKNYAIGSNIDASATSGWNSGAGFTPIAGGGTSRFSGNINGLGHSINNLYIQSPATSVIGLVGILDTNGAISNLSLAGGSVSASTNAINIGSLVGTNYGLISNSSSSTTVSSGASTQSIGGLVGGNAGTISNSFASGSVTTGTSTRAIGGLSGDSSGTIKFSYASGNVTAGSGSGGNGQAYYGGGGLVGFNSGSISDSQATGNVLLNGTGGDFGGFVGFAQGPSVITKSYATGSVTSTSSIRDIGGFVGNSNGSSIINNYSTGAVNAGAGSTWVGGFIGSNWSVSNVSNSYSTGTVICTNCTANPFAGGNIGSISNSFWNTQTSNISSNSITGGITGINSAQMKTLSTFTNVGWDSNIWLLNSSINSGFPSFTSGVLYVRFNTGTITYGSSPVLTYGIYDSYSGGNLLTNLNLAGTANLAATNNNISYSSLSNTSAAGTYTVNYLSGLSLANSLYALTPGNASNWIINKAGLTVTANSNSKVYGNSLSLNGTEFTTSGLQNGETATNANLAISGNGNLSTANVGTYSITPSLLSGGTFNSNNYTITYNPANLNVTARPINITANAASKVYGEANPSFSYATEVTSANRGLITGDAFTGGLSTSATQYSPVTSYAITSTLVNSNYAINYIGADLSVTARPINITANASTKIYGESNPALSYAAEVASTGRGWVNNDAFSGAISSAATNTSSVGSYPITSTLANSNYTINYTGANLNVTARPINITANAATKIYGELTNPALSYVAEATSTGRGLVGSDSFGGSLSSAVTQYSPIASYAISSSLANSNYAINYIGANLSVTARPINITANAATKVYGELTNPSLSYVAEVTSTGRGLVGSDALSGSLSTLVTQFSPVASYAITSTLSNSNYAVNYTGANLNVTARPINITANAASKVYGDTNPALTYITEAISAGRGLVGNDTFSGSLSTTATQYSPATSYPITSTLANSNYAINYTGANLTINKAILNTSVTKVYDATNVFTSNFTFTGTVNGESAPSVVSGQATVNSKNAATYTNFASNSLILDNQNYTLNGGFVFASITKKPLFLNTGISVSDKTYDGGLAATVNTSNVTASGLIYGDVITGVAATGSFQDKNAGNTKPVNITSLTLYGADANNYSPSVTQANISASILKAPITVTADSLTTTYTGATQFIISDNFSVSGLIGGDTKATLNGVSATGQGISAGTYPTVASGASTNYSITFIPGILTINKAGLTVTANSNSKVYGNSLSLNGTEFTTSGLQNGETATNANLAISGNGNLSTANVGTYSITPSLLSGGTFNSNNYTITYNPANLNVTARPINITANAASKVYGEANPSFSYATEVTSANRGLITGDAFTGGLSTSATQYSPVTSYAITSTLVNSNYAINYIGADLSVTARPINITANASTKIYGESNPALSYAAEVASTGRGWVNNDAFSGAISSAATNTSSVGSYPITSTLANSNYTINYTGANLNVTARPINITANAATKIYGEANPNFSYNSESASTGRGLITGDSFSGSLTTAASPSSSIGAYPISSTLANSNYAINYTGANLNVNKANATVIGLSGSTEFDGITKTLTGFTATGLVNNETTGDIARSANNPNGISASTSGRFSGTYLNTPYGTANNYNLSFVSGQLVITGCPGGPPCTPIGPQTTASNITPVVIPAMTAPSFSSAVVSTAAQTNSAAPVLAFASSSGGGSFGSGGGTLTLANNNAPTNSVNTVNVITVNNPTVTPVNLATTQPNVVNPQRLADILSKKDPVEIATALPPNQVAQLSPEQVAPLVNSLNLRQLMSLTNEQIAKFDPVRQAELLNIIKVIKDNPEKAAEKAFTPTDKTFGQLAANGLLKEQIDSLSTRVTQINQNKTNVNIDTPQKLAELLTKKDPVEIATALPSNQVAQLTPEQAAPLISSLTVRQLLALTNEQISKFEPARQTELLNIINVIKNNPEKAADKAYTAIDKTTAQYVANGLMKEQIDALASKVTQITQNKTTITFDGPQKLADILNNNTPVEVAKALPSNLVPQLSSDQVAPLINSMSVKQLLSLTNEQMSRLDPARLADLLNILKGLKDNPEKATDKTYTPEDTAVAKYAATGLLKDPIERLSLRANFIADNKFKDPLSKELADLTNPPVPANTSVARNTPNQANRPLNAAQLAAQNANSETPNLTPAQVAALDPKDLGPLLSKLNANQLMGITNAQMAGLDSAYLNQLTVLLNFVQDKVANPIANAGPIAQGNRVNNTNIFINQPVAKLAGAAILADQPNTASPTAPVPTPSTQLASVALTPKQVSELDPAQLAPLINQLNANQLMAITNAQMARMDGRALNQLTILMNFVQQRAANNNGPANGNNPAGTNTNINVFVNQPVSRLASNALLNEQPKPNATAGGQNLTQTNITVNLTPKQVSELDPTQLAPLISQLNANQLMAITNTQMARLDTQSINQLNILMNFVQQRALNSNTSTTIYINQPVSRIVAASLMNDQPLPSQVAGAAPAPIATVPLSPQQIANLTPNQVAPLLNRMNSRQLMAVTDTQMASLDSANLNQLITLLNFIQDSARTSPIVTNNFATRPVASFLPPELNTTQTVIQP